MMIPMNGVEYVKLVKKSSIALNNVIKYTKTVNAV